MIYGHGNDTYNYETEITADFSSNVAKPNTSERLLQYLQKKIRTINSYPDPIALQLRKAIARYHQLPDFNIITSNGSTEAFYLTAQAYARSNSFIRIPSFSEYEDACIRFNHQNYYADHISHSEIEKCNMVWLGNPNNPNGIYLNKNEIEELCTKYPDKIFVIDEAFSDMCHGFESAIPLISENKNIIIIRSLTKAFSIPGLRIGYVIAKKEIIDKISQYVIPWSVNSLAIDAGIFIMNNYEMLLHNTLEMKKLTKQFMSQLDEIKGIKTYPSECNFFLVELDKPDATKLKTYLIQNHGLLIRDASNFRGLGSQYIRLSTRSKQQNKLLTSAIEQWINE